MAKKGGGQLQTDLGSDEEFERFLDRSGLIVCDVYTEWSGPCTSVVTNLKAAKMAIGGNDVLHYAIVRCDDVALLKRFEGHCEPTWMFITDGRATNLMFGVNVPRLISLIESEVEMLGAKNREYFAINELQPEEIDRRNKVLAAEAEAKRLEIEEAERKRKEYYDYCTNTIIDNLHGYGITIFGPHVKRERDMYKKLIEQGEMLRLTLRDRIIVQIDPNQIDIMHYHTHTVTLEPDFLDQLYANETLVCLWESGEGETKPVEEVLARFVKETQTSQPARDNDGNIVPDEFLPPLLEVANIKIKPPPPEMSVTSDGFQAQEEVKAQDSGELLVMLSMAIMSQIAEEVLAEEEVVQEEEEPEILEEPESEVYLRIVTIPPIWTPMTKRVNAAGVYVFFRNHTEEFLPPDPPPIPEHLVVVFDAVKKKDVVPLFDKFKDDILLYGYFDSAIPEQSHLVANSTKKYVEMEPAKNDKLIIKVGKKTSHCVLALAVFGPLYVSPNVLEGKREAKLFFPEGYKTGEMEEAEKGEQPEIVAEEVAPEEQEGEEEEIEDEAYL